jgi:hypothetical protein
MNIRFSPSVYNYDFFLDFLRNTLHIETVNFDVGLQEIHLLFVCFIVYLAVASQLLMA